MSRPSAFAHWLSQQEWRQPEDMLQRYWKTLEAAAYAVGAKVGDDPLIMDGKRHYLPNLKGENDQRQYYLASLEKHSDNTLWPEITFGSFKASVDNHYWNPREQAWQEFEAFKRGGRKVDADSEALRQYRDSIAEQFKRAEQIKRERDELMRLANDAARAATAMIFSNAARPFVQGETHDYTKRKGLVLTGKVRVATADMQARVYSVRYHEWRDDVTVCRQGDLLIPMMEAVPGGKTWNVQRIAPDGSKMFLPGSRKAGLYHGIPGNDDLIIVCEGWATGLTLNQATGYTVFVAFDVDNLDAVINFAQGEAAGKPVINAADNDWETALKPQMRGKNPGLDKGRDIERQVSVPCMAPQFTAEDKGCSDWDDYRQKYGQQALAVIRDALHKAVRAWCGMPGNDAAHLSPALAQALQPPTAPVSTPAPVREQGDAGKPKAAGQGDAEGDTEVMVEQAAAVSSMPPHFGSKGLDEVVYVEHFPYYNEKMTAPLDTRENLQYLLEVYGISCRYNRISKDHEIKIPGHEFSRDNAQNAAMAELTSLCKRSKLPTGSLDLYLISIGDRNSYNPIADWIRSKKWDGMDRVRQLLNTIRVPSHYPVEMRDMLVTKWMLSAVAAAMAPDNKPFNSKGVLVLQGAQSIGKTSWFKRLVSDSMRQFIKDGLHLDPANKDTVFTAMSHWMVELGELDATFRKADVARLKAFLTLTEDRLRRPFERKDSQMPRRTVFFASVNDKNFLVDDTGNSRWWTVEVESLDYQHNIDMQQLWAQLYEQWYRNGIAWWLSPDEEAMLNASNAEYEVIDPYEERIISAFNFTTGVDVSGKRTYQCDPATDMMATEVLIQIGYDKPDRKLATAIGKTLSRMGLKPKRSNRGSVYRMPALRFNQGNGGGYGGGQYGGGYS